MADETPHYSLGSDIDYLAKLDELVAAGKVRVKFELARLRGLDSPIAVQADTERWALGLVALTGIAWWWQGIPAAAAVFGLGVVAYLAIGRPGVARRLEQRIHQKALKDIAVWRALWQHGGISLEATSGTHEPCVAPKGSWIRFLEGVMADSQPPAAR